MPSTAISCFYYDPDREDLIVEFITGRRYVYHAVPLATASDFQGAFSKGRYFNAHIRDRYDFEELESAS